MYYLFMMIKVVLFNNDKCIFINFGSDDFDDIGSIYEYYMYLVKVYE